MTDNTPTDDEREALWDAFDDMHRITEGGCDTRGDHVADMVLGLGFRRTEVPEPSRPPVYLAADLWQALGAPISDFDAYYDRNGWADTWANLLGAVRDRFRPKCGQDAEGEPCVLTTGHLPPHYGSSDVGSSEPVPVPEPPGEPSDAQVALANLRSVVNAGSRQIERDVEWIMQWIEDGEAGGVDADALSKLRAYVSPLRAAGEVER